MYRFIMIDDEKYALDEMAQMFEWEEMGFELAGTFTNTDDAFRFLEENQINLVVSDIKMPGHSGLDLAKICYEKYPDVLIMLISVYRDFEHARLAMQYNVKRYLLKPISYDEVKNAFLEMKKILDSTNKQFSFQKEELIMNRQALFSSIVYGVPIDNIDQKLKDVGIFSDFKNYAVYLISISMNNFAEQLKKQWKYGKDNLYNAISKFICFEDEYAYYSILSNSFDKILLICLSKVEENIDKNVFDFMSVLSDNLKTFLGLDADIEIKQKFENLSKVIINERPIPLTERCVRTVFSYIAGGKIVEAKKMVRSLFDEYEGQDDFIRLLYNQFVDMFGNIVQIDENGLEFNNMTDKDYYELIVCIIDKAISYFGENDDGENRIILKALSYINEHYKEEITLEDVSKYISFNSNYFSSYFKKCIGERFVDYLIKFRMEKAIELIRKDRNINISDVCENVGYNSVPHFYKVFRAYTGYTPAEYRKSLKKDSV